MVALVVSEGDDAADGGMALEQRGDARVEHEVDLRIGVGTAQGAEQRRGQDGVAHLPETDDEDMLNFHRLLELWEWCGR